MKFAKNNFLHFDGRMNNILVRENKCFYSAFTLAEMMVVMLILSIIMAAMAPVMTTRNKLDQSAPWSWATNGSDAYYGLGDAQVAMIGQEEVKPTDDGARLIINSPSSLNHILFKNGDTVNGFLKMSNNRVFLGKLESGKTIGTISTGFGLNIAPSGLFSVSLGIRSSSSGQYSLSTGFSNSAEGNFSMAIGSANTATASDVIAQGSSNEVSGDYSIAIGHNNTVSGQDSIVLGRSNTLDTDNSIGIGMGVTSAENSIAIGKESHANGQNSIAISNGSSAETLGEYSISIGSNNSNPTGAYSIAIGESSVASQSSSVAIGSNSNAESNLSVLVGNNTHSTEDYSIAIGDGASNVEGSYDTGGIGAIAIGQASMTSEFMGIAIGRNSIASGISSIALGSSDGIDSKTQSLAENSIAIGMNATARGVNNIAIGANACQYANGYGVTCIGADSGPESSGETANLRNENNIMFLGTSATTVYIPGNLVVEGDVILGRNGGSRVTARAVDTKRGHDHISNGETATRMGIFKSEDFNGEDDNLDEWTSGRTNYKTFFNFWLSSDRRLKYVGSESTSGLDKIRQLKVFNYTFKKDEKKVPHVGVIAQDLQKVFPNAVKKGVDGFLTIRMEDMFYAMINAIKELDSKISTLEKENKELKAALKQLQENNKKQEARLKALEAKIK